MRRILVAALTLALCTAARADNQAPIVRGLGLTSQSAQPFASTTVSIWRDAASNLRLSDATHNGVGSNYVCAAPVASKGDLAVFNGTNWLPLSVGPNTQVLTADSTQASGLKWAAGGGGGGTQSGTTSASHVPYASGANTLADGEMSFNSGTHTYSLAASTILDWSASSGAFKTTTGAATFGGSSNTFTNSIATDAASSLKGVTNPSTYVDVSANVLTLSGAASQVRPPSANSQILGAPTFEWAGVYTFWNSTKLSTQLTAASTITPVSGLHHVTGATTITTISALNVQGNGSLTLIADGGTITLSTGGNIAAAVTIAQDKAQAFVYDSAVTTWYPVQ